MLCDNSNRVEEAERKYKQGVWGVGFDGAYLVSEECMRGGMV